MKQSKELIDSRRKKALLIINENKSISNKDLAYKLDVSLPTIRRDINYLSKKGLIHKTHGEVQAIDSKVILTTRIEKKKDLIAKYAASLVDNDDTIFINSSDTSIKTIKYVEPSKYISVVTNNGKALKYHTLPNVKIILTGGEIKAPKSAMTGEFAIKNIKGVQANKAFLGASGFHLEEGMTTANIDEVAVNKAMIGNANTVILCVDSSKLNHKSAFISGSVRNFDILITDSDADSAFIDNLTMLGVECILLDIDKEEYR
ncbi:DeoR/GlpR family DNA-binding transcription regulator [Helcococcus kunzii]|uniref:DeoR/GlpR family DNA-binding transcription regulator n=1 Tax=Helcococcus kunzii TaxID=40091 RepID=UPI0024ACB57E|nr:DeoR/GlpR family DNA-binding transcription regulator [Helcococcus kunzii]